MTSLFCHELHHIGFTRFIVPTRRKPYLESMGNHISNFTSIPLLQYNKMIPAKENSRVHYSRVNSSKVTIYRKFCIVPVQPTRNASRV
jgi:hypothetical protein